MMKQYSQKKKLLYSAVIIFFSLVLVEPTLHLLFIIINHQVYPIHFYDNEIHRVASLNLPLQEEKLLSGGEVKRVGTIEVIHPYLGFVLDPERTPNTSSLGFPSKSDDPFLEKRGNTLTVAVFGGSFAAGVSIQGRSRIKSTLQDHGIKANVLNIAIGGYKQPQQLHALAYLISQGADIDVVVNIDGFNEVALPQAENIPKGVNPFYPRAWYTRTLRLHDQVTLRQIGRVAALEDDRRQWAMIFSDMPKYSIIRNIIWRAYDMLLEKRVMEINDQIRRSQLSNSTRFLTTGPDLEIDEEEELYQQIANHWRSCSLLMKALCDSQDIMYIHALQPNQYFEAGRILTETEEKIAFQKDHPYRPGVVKGYPLLLTEKKYLLDHGVNFHDLTMIYHDIPQPIYIDDCCHPNQLGYEIIGEYVANTIIEEVNIQAADQNIAEDARISRR